MIVNPLRIFATLFFVVVGVAGQNPDTCIETCLTGALSNKTCTSATNTSCICANTAYQAAVAACLTANCTTADEATAKALQQSECGSSSNSSTSSSNKTTTTDTSSTSKSTGSSSTSSTKPTSSGSSSASGAVHGQVPFLNAAFALATVALGGAFLL